MVNSIRNNLTAAAALRGITTSSAASAASTVRLSSGNRINTASHDVAGLAVGTSLTTRTLALGVALTNVAQGSSLLQVADGALAQIINLLQRQKAIAVQASSGQLTDTNRSLLQAEFANLTAEIDRQASSTNFNGVPLLLGGQGAKATLANTNALAASSLVGTPNLQVSGGGTTTTSSTPIQAFNIATGASLAGTGAAGRLQFVDANGTLLSNAAYDTVSPLAVGQFSDFRLSDVTYGATNRASATLTAVLNGVEYTGKVVANGTPRVILSNGDTHLNLRLPSVVLTNAATAENSIGSIRNAFANTVIARTSILGDVDFNGTRLDGAIGTATKSTANVRLTSSGPVNIGEFSYVGNRGTANSNTLAVVINGTTFLAESVRDNITSGNIQFRDEARLQVLSISTAGLSSNLINIRTNPRNRELLLDALNTAFSRAGSALNFSAGAASSNTISVKLDDVSTRTLYGGKSLDVATAANAQESSNELNLALDRATAARAKVGGIQSRFDFAANNIRASLFSQSNARSTLLDTDVAAESTAFSSSQAQLQAGTLVLAQANRLPRTLLDLLDTQGQN